MQTDKRKKTDRRKSETNYRRRRRDRREGVFYYEREAFLTDTNFFRNVYFAQYFDFIGEAREYFFEELVGDAFPELVASGLTISTVDTNIKYKNELFLYDKFRVEIRIKKLGRIKVKMEFTFVTDSQEIAKSEMNICFKMNNEPITVPDLVKGRLKQLNMISS